MIHQLTLSAGAIVELLHAVRHTVQPVIDHLKARVRASPILHGMRPAGARTAQWLHLVFQHAWSGKGGTSADALVLM